MHSPAEKIGWIGRLAAGLVIAVMLLGAMGLFGIYAQHKETHRQFEATGRLRNLETALREVLIGFKLEIQEWKNLLLRGQDAEGFAKWKAIHHERVEATKQALQQLESMPNVTKEELDEIRAIAKIHSDNAQLYNQALTQYRQGDPGSILAVDAAVRGKDRAIAEALDELAEGIRNREIAQINHAEADGEERYHGFRNATLLVAAITAALTLVLAAAVAKFGGQLAAKAEH